MTPFEMISSLLAPHLCLLCKTEGSLMCPPCGDTLTLPLPRCYRCNEASAWFKTCSMCIWRYDAPLDHVWTRTQYIDPAKEMVRLLKFGRAKASAATIARHMLACTPPLPPDVIIVPIPTATKRIRTRGYDQAALIARQLAKCRGVQYREALFRTNNTRQVGAGRHGRRTQLKGVFISRRPDELTGKQILLVDDVLTTGATLESAAYTLRKCGVTVINAVVFAH